MAPGPAPKDPSKRRNRSAPLRGEWVDLPELAKPILPELPEGEWSERTKNAWQMWREDPATGQLTKAGIAAAIDAIYLYEEFVQGETKLAAELRLRMDGLGLTPKGKRDLRWRTKQDAKVEELNQAKRKREPLVKIVS